jgi:hypothetical protein
MRNTLQKTRTWPNPAYPPWRGCSELPYQLSPAVHGVLWLMALRVNMDLIVMRHFRCHVVMDDPFGVCSLGSSPKRISCCER